MFKVQISSFWSSLSSMSSTSNMFYKSRTIFTKVCSGKIYSVSNPSSLTRYKFTESNTNNQKILKYPIDFATQIMFENKLSLYCQAVDNDHEIAKKIFMNLNKNVQILLANYLCSHYQQIDIRCIVIKTIEASDDFCNLLIEKIILKQIQWPETFYHGNKIINHIFQKLSLSTKVNLFKYMILNMDTVPLRVLCVASIINCELSTIFNNTVSDYVLYKCDQIIKTSDRTLKQNHDIFKLNWCGLLSSNYNITQWEYFVLKNIELYGYLNKNIIEYLICCGTQTFKNKLINQIMKIKNVYMYDDCMIYLKEITDKSDEKTFKKLNDYYLEHSKFLTHNFGYMIGLEWNLRFIRKLEVSMINKIMKDKKNDDFFMGLREGIHERLNYDLF